MKLLSDISKERLVITSTHNYEDAKDYADYFVRLYKGNLVSFEAIKTNDNVNTKNPVDKKTKINDLYVSCNKWNITILRYFNPIGAHKSGLIGEKPNGIPNNLMPYIVRVASGELEMLNVFGDDYDTHDGTGVRDYIHVVDLAKGHIKALEKSFKDEGVFYYNLGTGTGYSVLDLVKNFEKVNKVKVPYKIVDRRPGDIACCYADPTKAYKELGWKAELDIKDMVRDSYNFIVKQEK